MTNQLDKPNKNPDDTNDIFGTVTDLLTGCVIPAPIRKNVFKAFGQLCSSAVDIPVAHLEGIATEKRAETQARVKIISTGADQIASQMNVEPEYARVAVEKYGQKIVREQVNLDRVSEAAAFRIQQNSTNPNVNSDSVRNEVTEAPPINDDWLNEFEREASQKSTEEMQLLFGRILAGEIQRPSSFSIKTVKLLGSLDNQAASLFRRLCSLSVSLRLKNHIYDARVVSIDGNASSNSLLSYGLGFDQLNILHEYGLIVPDYNCYKDYQGCITDEEHHLGIPLNYQKQSWALVPFDERSGDGALKLNGVALSFSGRELLRIVDVEPVEQYTGAIREFFEKHKLRMVEVITSDGSKFDWTK